MHKHKSEFKPSNASKFYCGAHAKRLVAYGTMLSTLLTPIMASPVYAAIADVPLYLSNPVEPNIMFVLDDSGSMQWDVVPDSSTVYFMFPRPATMYGINYESSYGSLTTTGGTYNGVAEFDQTNRYARYFRTARFNPLYYDPAIRYTPWRNPDNSPMPVAYTVPAAGQIEAQFNPMNAGEGSRNLTIPNTHNAVWIADNGNEVAGSRTYYPATYFKYTGPGTLTGPTHGNNILSNFTRVEIKPANAPFAKAVAREDCIGATCTYDEEIKNFANWFSFYRSRILAARAGIGTAFARQGEAMRVGFGAINKGSTTVDGSSRRTIVSGVRSFSGANRAAFFSSLYNHVMPAEGTPLRQALDDVGQYYSSSDNRGPWGDTPGSTTSGTHLQCRQSYTILMTDGYWTTGSSYDANTANARSNNDGTAGPTITGPTPPLPALPQTFTYAAVSPFADSYSNTLADVAMYYWKRDLRTDVPNSVPTSPENPAFWQHMSTFGVGLGVTGTIDPVAAFAAINDPAVAIGPWPDPTPSSTAANPAKLDDLLHAAVNGRGGFFTTSDPIAFADQLSSQLSAITARVSSSSSVAASSTRAITGTNLYQAQFKSGDWSGQFKAFPLSVSGTVGSQVWDASTVLPAHGSRNIKTWNGSSGADFNGALNATLTAALVDYLRGKPNDEVINGGTFRNRRIVNTDTSSKLGDIINSDPQYVKDENFGYSVLSGSEGATYSAFVAGKSTRTAMVYVGANDGMLHGFRASDGVEQFAYVPNAVWPKLPLLASTTYTHKYFVDGSPTTWDAYLSGSWKSVLAGSLGAGGKAVYLLDVTNPTAFNVGNVLWEFNGGAAANDMGHVMGSVPVARFADGKYWAVFGNGYGSTNGKAVLFMVGVGHTGVKTIDVGGAAGNGLSTPTLVDLNGDRIIDRIYAGDLKGNVWNFNVTSSSASSWASAYGALPLFQAKDSLGNPQPITAPVEVGLAPGGASGLMVYFGTGKYFETGDNATTTRQSMYGVVDNGSTFSGASHRTQLQTQSIVYETTAAAGRARVISDNAVDYATQKGWVLDFLSPPAPGTALGERVISAPLLFDGRLILQTIIPSVSPCDYGGASWLMQIDPSTGGRTNTAVFNVDADSNTSFDGADRVDIGNGTEVHVSGLDIGIGISGGVGSPISGPGSAIVTVSGTTNSNDNSSNNNDLNDNNVVDMFYNPLKPRASWRQIQ